MMRLHTLEITIVEVGEGFWRWRLANVEPWLAAPHGRIVHEVWGGEAQSAESALRYAMAKRRDVINIAVAVSRKLEEV